MIVTPLKMLECGVRELLVLVMKETSDLEEAMLLEDVWKSATTTSGAQCVIIEDGAPLMLR